MSEENRFCPTLSRSGPFICLKFDCFFRSAPCQSAHPHHAEAIEPQVVTHGIPVGARRANLDIEDREREGHVCGAINESVTQWKSGTKSISLHRRCGRADCSVRRNAFPVWNLGFDVVDLVQRQQMCKTGSISQYTSPKKVPRDTCLDFQHLLKNKRPTSKPRYPK